MKLKLLAPALILLAGCANQQPVADARSVETVKLEKGTKIKAVLLKELTSGGSQEGSEVPMMVSEDIKDAKGRILVAKGTPLTGEVTWSRTEGTLGAITNQPARLKFKFKAAKAADGAAVKLSAKAEAEEEYELNRENTGKTDASAQLETLASDKTNEKALEAIRELFENGDAAKLDAPENREQLVKIAEALGLPTTSKLQKENELNKVGELVEQIRRGATVANLATGGSASLVDAALELAGVAGQVGNRLGKALGGRNIRAYVGTPVEGFVLETVEVKVAG